MPPKNSHINSLEARISASNPAVAINPLESRISFRSLDQSEQKMSYSNRQGYQHYSSYDRDDRDWERARDRDLASRIDLPNGNGRDFASRMDPSYLRPQSRNNWGGPPQQPSKSARRGSDYNQYSPPEERNNVLEERKRKFADYDPQASSTDSKKVHRDASVADKAADRAGPDRDNRDYLPPPAHSKEPPQTSKRRDRMDSYRPGQTSPSPSPVQAPQDAAGNGNSAHSRTQPKELLPQKIATKELLPEKAATLSAVAQATSAHQISTHTLLDTGSRKKSIPSATSSSPIRPPSVRPPHDNKKQAAPTPPVRPPSVRPSSLNEKQDRTKTPLYPMQGANDEEGQRSNGDLLKVLENKVNSNSGSPPKTQGNARSSVAPPGSSKAISPPSVSTVNSTSQPQVLGMPALPSTHTSAAPVEHEPAEVKTEDGLSQSSLTLPTMDDAADSETVSLRRFQGVQWENQGLRTQIEGLLVELDKKERERKQWQAEKKKWEFERKQWETEREQHKAEKAHWEAEKADFYKLRETFFKSRNTFLKSNVEFLKVCKEMDRWPAKGPDAQ